MESINIKMIPLIEDDVFKLQELVEECDVQISFDSYSIINLGYQFLTDSAKITYLYMKSMAENHVAKCGQPICYMNVDYLAVIYNTTVKTQRNILNSLIDCFLIEEISEGYIVYDPIIESTFKETVLKFLYRKELKNTLSYISSCNNPKDRVDHLRNLEFLTSKKDEHPFLQDVYNSFKNKIEKII